MKKVWTHNNCLPPHIRIKKTPKTYAVSRTKNNKDKLDFIKRFGEVFII